MVLSPDITYDGYRSSFRLRYYASALLHALLLPFSSFYPLASTSLSSPLFLFVFLLVMGINIIGRYVHLIPGDRIGCFPVPFQLFGRKSFFILLYLFPDIVYFRFQIIKFLNTAYFQPVIVKFIAIIIMLFLVG